MGLHGGGDLAEVLEGVVAPAARRRRRGRVEGVHLPCASVESERPRLARKVVPPCPVLVLSRGFFSFSFLLLPLLRMDGWMDFETGDGMEGV